MLFLISLPVIVLNYSQDGMNYEHSFNGILSVGNTNKPPGWNCIFDWWRPDVYCPEC